jgi:hypothetical protein
MALNFGILQPMNISGDIAAGRQETQRNQLAQQQMAANQQQMRTSQLQERQTGMQLEQAMREREALDKMQKAFIANNKSGDLGANFDEMIQSGVPHFVDIGIKGKQALQNQKNFESLLKGSFAPTTAMPSVAPPSGALGSGTFDPNAPATTPVAPRNAMATTPLAPVNAMAATPDTANLRRQIDAAYALGTPQALAWAQAREKELAEMIKPQTAPDAKLMQQLGYPLTPEGYQAFRDAQRQERMLSPEEEKQKVRIAAASRAPVQPVAPTITQIVDPTNPNQMISIDAKRYKGGGAGSPGVIGVSGKEPGAALRTNKVEQGKTQLADDLENLRASFETLDKLRAVPSTERGPLSNVTSAIASSRVGQLTGQAFATEAQVERDVINSARSRLVNSIKNATGMSAQQLNSNVELQTMLKSISDPGQSYQSALRIIDDIEKAYVTGNGTLPKKDKPGGAPAATQGTGGFKYLGKESK